MAVATRPYPLRFHISEAKSRTDDTDGDGKVAHTRVIGPTIRGFAKATREANTDTTATIAAARYSRLSVGAPLSTTTAIAIKIVTIVAATKAVRDPAAHTPSQVARPAIVAIGTRYLPARHARRTMPPSHSAATVPLKLAPYTVPPARPITPNTLSWRKLTCK